MRTALVGFLLLVPSFTIPIAPAEGQTPLRVAWQDNSLRIYSDRVPGGSVEVWYLEALCRRGSTRRDWNKTVLPHSTALRMADPAGRRIVLESVAPPSVLVEHVIAAGTDAVVFNLTLSNSGADAVDVEWAQPCIRVGRFTGLGQEDYIRRCFVFTEAGLQTLDRISRTEEAIYRGGQVYVPRGIDREDVNPRPISPEIPTNGLIGCFSSDDSLLLATAWDRTQELFQGVIACIHSDFKIGGLAPGETKKIFGKIYLMENDPKALLARYAKDFPNGSFGPG